MIVAMDLTPGVLFEYFKFTETPEMEVLGAEFSQGCHRLELLDSYRRLAEAEINKLSGDDFCLGQIGLDVRIAFLCLQGGNYFEFKERITECCVRMEQEGFAEQVQLLDSLMARYKPDKPE